MAARGEPYLSLVVAARNDNHGGNMLQRMQGMLDSWIRQAERCGLSSEIVVVEWNPPADRARLKDSLRWSARPEYCQVRFIDVPAEVHGRFGNAAAIPLHQMIAKNAGIRRARGEFVLATNLDIIFSAELVEYLAQRCLESGVMYRIDRHDVSNAIRTAGSVDELLAFCDEHMLRVFAREGEFQLGADGRRSLDQRDIVAQDAGVRFGSGFSSVESSDQERYRWVESQAEFFFERPSSATPQLLFTMETGPSANDEPVGVEIIEETGFSVAVQIKDRCELRLRMPAQISHGRLLLRVRGSDLPLTRNPRIANLRVVEIQWERGGPAPQDNPGHWRLDVVGTRPAFNWARSLDAASPFARQIKNAKYLHTNACGDFTLLSRADWFSLRAYPEFPIWPMHIDALFCYAAYHAGVRESILREPLRIYHVEHGSAAGWSPEGEKERLARIAAKGLSELSYSGFARWIDLLRRYDAPAMFTCENWGLGDFVPSEDRAWL